MSEFSMTIDGKAVFARDPGTTLAVLDPATEEVIARPPVASRADLDEAVAAAQRAFGSWSQTSLAERKHKLHEIADALEMHAKLLGMLITREQGKILEKGIEEAAASATWFRATAKYEIPTEVIEQSATSRIEIRRKPLGVVGAITPWNFPLRMGVWKIAPALLTGNTIVLKPSPYTPLSTLKFGEILREILPPGVLNVICGGNEVGEWMTQHSGIRKIAFTGSVPTGKKILENAATNLKRVTLELGGNDAAIVLDDVNPQRIAPKIFRSAFNNCGQVCVAIKRLYVHEKIHDALCAALVKEASQVKLGSGTDPGVQMGPLNNRMQYERIGHFVEEAKRSGARVLIGGAPLPGPGYFYPPTLISDISEGLRLVDEEQFGPVLPILRFADVEDVLRRANASPYGLGGSVWTNDFARGAELAARLECGTAWLNQHGILSPTLPFGGVKCSGLGREHGPHGLEEYLELQVLNFASQA